MLQNEISMSAKDKQRLYEDADGLTKLGAIYGKDVSRQLMVQNGRVNCITGCSADKQCMFYCLGTQIKQDADLATDLQQYIS